MTESKTKQQSRFDLHRTFGGYITEDDFNGICGYKTKGEGNERSAMADRIASDKRFDMYCKRNIADTEHAKEYGLNIAKSRKF